MERINLLPDELALTLPNRVAYLVDKKFVPTLIRSVSVVAGALFLLSVGAGLFSKTYEEKTERVQERQEILEEELREAAALSDELRMREEQLTQQITRHKERLVYLENYRDRRGRWDLIFREIKRVMPYGVWLTQLDGSEKGYLRLVGGAFEEDLVTQFMGELKEAPPFSEVTFQFTRKDKIGKTDIVRFEVSCKAAASRVEG
jgi:Tfp pilus assembly protein PilN